jgi:uncharacterized membrane protein YjjB (DUF3815 family)
MTEIRQKFDMVMRTKSYPFWLECIAYAVIAGAFTLFFGGNVTESIVSLVVGGIVRFVVLLADKCALNKIFAKFLCCFCATAMAFIAVRLGIIASVDMIIIGNIMTLIPGIGLTNALRDLFTGDSISGLYAAAIMTMLIKNAQELNLVGASYFALVNEGLIRVYPDHVEMSPDGEVLKRMKNHADGEILEEADKCCVRTLHEGYEFISVYNDSSTEDKLLEGISGEYEILTRRDAWMDVASGAGELKAIPPASVAFVRCEL